jgi:hypothetical protein
MCGVSEHFLSYEHGRRVVFLLYGCSICGGQGGAWELCSHGLTIMSSIYKDS